MGEVGHYKAVPWLPVFEETVLIEVGLYSFEIHSIPGRNQTAQAALAFRSLAALCNGFIGVQIVSCHGVAHFGPNLLILWTSGSARANAAGLSKCLKLHDQDLRPFAPDS